MKVDEPKVVAAGALRQGASYAKAAEAAGVHRATVIRWAKDPEFAELVEADPTDDVAQAALAGLADLVPKALKLLDVALEPDSKISGQAAKNAIDVIKAATAIRKQSVETGGSGTLEARLAALDEREGEAFDEHEGDGSPSPTQE